MRRTLMYRGRGVSGCGSALGSGKVRQRSAPGSLCNGLVLARSASCIPSLAVRRQQRQAQQQPTGAVGQETLLWLCAGADNGAEGDVMRRRRAVREQELVAIRDDGEDVAVRVRVHHLGAQLQDIRSASVHSLMAASAHLVQQATDFATPAARRLRLPSQMCCTVFADANLTLLKAVVQTRDLLLGE